MAVLGTTRNGNCGVTCSAGKATTLRVEVSGDMTCILGPMCVSSTRVLNISSVTNVGAGVDNWRVAYAFAIRGRTDASDAGGTHDKLFEDPIDFADPGEKLRWHGVNEALEKICRSGGRQRCVASGDLVPPFTCKLVPKPGAGNGGECESQGIWRCVTCGDWTFVCVNCFVHKPGEGDDGNWR